VDRGKQDSGLGILCDTQEIQGIRQEMPRMLPATLHKSRGKPSKPTGREKVWGTTWNQLVEVNPALVRYAEEAREAVDNGWPDWPCHLETAGHFKSIIAETAKAGDLDHEAVWNCATDYLSRLFTFYRTENPS